MNLVGNTHPIKIDFLASFTSAPENIENGFYAAKREAANRLRAAKCSISVEETFVIDPESVTGELLPAFVMSLHDTVLSQWFYFLFVNNESGNFEPRAFTYGYVPNDAHLRRLGFMDWRLKKGSFNNGKELYYLAPPERLHFSVNQESWENHMRQAMTALNNDRLSSDLDAMHSLLWAHVWFAEISVLMPFNADWRYLLRYSYDRKGKTLKRPTDTTPIELDYWVRTQIDKGGLLVDHVYYADIYAHRQGISDLLQCVTNSQDIEAVLQHLFPNSWEKKFNEYHCLFVIQSDGDYIGVWGSPSAAPSNYSHLKRLK